MMMVSQHPNPSPTSNDAGDGAFPGVANDVEASFAPLRDGRVEGVQRPAQPLRARAVRARVKPGRGARTLMMGAVIASVLVAALLAAVYMRHALEEQSWAAAALQASMPTSPAPPVIAAPVSTPRADVSDAYPTGSLNAVALDTPQGRSGSSAQAKKALARSAAKIEMASARAPAASGLASGCQRLDGHRRQTCYHEQVIRADRQLRWAYADAAEAGVSRPVMVSYRDQWADLRGQAIRDPTRVVDDYGAMARDLRHEAQVARNRQY